MKHTRIMTRKNIALETADAGTIITIIATVLTAVASLLTAISPLIGNKG
ncbi:MAG TPA: hypothetical protein PLX23_07955 [Candidatus Hydrogenedens sp.]|nr:hypothetical protein [Candidatus Hydrogenedens sp.]